MPSSAIARRSRGLALALAVPAAILIVTATASGSALFHAHLAKSVPAAADTVRAAPTSIRLWFTEKPTPAMSSVVLVGPGGARVAVASPQRDAREEKELIAQVTGTIRPGGYRVDWRTMGEDGHPVHGSFRFVVSAQASASRPAPASRGSERELLAADAP